MPSVLEAMSFPDVRRGAITERSTRDRSTRDGHFTNSVLSLYTKEGES